MLIALGALCALPHSHHIARKILLLVPPNCSSPSLNLTASASRTAPLHRLVPQRLCCRSRSTKYPC